MIEEKSGMDGPSGCKRLRTDAKVKAPILMVDCRRCTGVVLEKSTVRFVVILEDRDTTIFKLRSDGVSFDFITAAQVANWGNG